MRDLNGHLELCSINTATLGHQAPIEQVIEAVARAGFGHIAPWRHEIEGNNIHAIAKQMRDAGLKTNAYCRSTYIPANTLAQRQANIADNKRAIADAAILGATVFVMVVGSIPPSEKNLASPRQQVSDAVAELLPFAKSCGVRIGLEPLHPVYAADRSCINLISQALDICQAIEGHSLDPYLGTVIDCYHVWWDPYLAHSIASAGDANRIFGFHVSDWLNPTQDILKDRGLMGDGVIDIKAIRQMIETAGYAGPIETEIFSAQNWWMRPMAETLAAVAERLQTCV